MPPEQMTVNGVTYIFHLSPQPTAAQTFTADKAAAALWEHQKTPIDKYF
jgi:hypothetical protein